MYDFSGVVNYLLFLKDQQGLSISLHTSSALENLISTSDLMIFDIHDNSYCTLIKRSPKAWAHCIGCKKNVLERSKQGSYAGTCFAGVKEIIYPISNGAYTVGFISVSGYQTDTAESYITKLSGEYGFSECELSNAYHSLKRDFPDKKDVDTLIIPLCEMLELAYHKTTTLRTELSLAEKILQYIKQNRTQNISSKDICNEFSCSRSYMSTLFNKSTGKTIREYLTELRIADAKALLQHSNLSITEISFSIGFSNSNYFSDRFKKQVGVSPLAYRKASRK